MFSQDFKKFVALLIKNKAEYLIVGVTQWASMGTQDIRVI